MKDKDFEKVYFVQRDMLHLVFVSFSLNIFSWIKTNDVTWNHIMNQPHFRQDHLTSNIVLMSNIMENYSIVWTDLKLNAFI